MRKRWLLFLFLTTPLACGTSRGTEGDITDVVFIDVMTDLRQAALADTTPEGFAERKAEILREAGVTDSALVAFARIHGEDVGRMARLWDSIDARLAAQHDSAR